MIQSQDRRLLREAATIQAMIDLYCKEQHGTTEQICPECQELSTYALARLEKCPFGTAKPTCANCKIHCYRAEMREKIRTVMRYAGPRMLLHHPVLAVLHLVDGKRSTPDKPVRKANG